MARYNHFGKNKYRGVCFAYLEIGVRFGKLHNRHSTHEKTGPLQYKNRKTGELTDLFGNNFTVYIKHDASVLVPGESLACGPQGIAYVTSGAFLDAMGNAAQRMFENQNEKIE